jgi:hypothetical protein
MDPERRKEVIKRLGPLISQQHGLLLDAATLRVDPGSEEWLHHMIISNDRRRAQFTEHTSLDNWMESCKRNLNPGSEEWVDFKTANIQGPPEQAEQANRASLWRDMKMSEEDIASLQEDFALAEASAAALDASARGTKRKSIAWQMASGRETDNELGQIANGAVDGFKKPRRADSDSDFSTPQTIPQPSEYEGDAWLQNTIMPRTRGKAMAKNVEEPIVDDELEVAPDHASSGADEEEEENDPAEVETQRKGIGKGKGKAQGTAPGKTPSKTPGKTPGKDRGKTPGKDRGKGQNKAAEKPEEAWDQDPDRYSAKFFTRNHLRDWARTRGVKAYHRMVRSDLEAAMKAKDIEERKKGLVPPQVPMPPKPAPYTPRDKKMGVDGPKAKAKAEVQDEAAQQSDSDDEKRKANNESEVDEEGEDKDEEDDDDDDDEEHEDEEDDDEEVDDEDEDDEDEDDEDEDDEDEDEEDEDKVNKRANQASQLDFIFNSRIDYAKHVANPDSIREDFLEYQDENMKWYPYLEFVHNKKVLRAFHTRNPSKPGPHPAFGI